MVRSDLRERRTVGLGAPRICEGGESTVLRGSCGGATDLKSRLRALTASLAFDSFEDARSQTSRTRAQSSEAVAVR
jgi:hypothetical protein